MSTHRTETHRSSRAGTAERRRQQAILAGGQQDEQAEDASSPPQRSDGPATPQDRRAMIAVAAYYRAQRREFRDGDPLDDWLAAEVEVDAMLAAPPAPSSEKKNFEHVLEARLNEWDARLDRVVAAAKKAKAGAKTELDSQLQALAARRAAIDEQLQALRQRGEGAWEDLREGADRTWEDMRKTMDNVLARFK